MIGESAYLKICRIVDLLSMGVKPGAQIAGGDEPVDVAPNLIENVVDETRRCRILDRSALPGRHGKQACKVAPNGVHVVGMTGDFAEGRDGDLPNFARLQVLTIDVATGASEPREERMLLEPAFDEGQQLLLKLSSEAHGVVP